MAVISLPLNFANSFWSQDYRKGLEVLYAKLEQGTAENDQVVAFIRARAKAEARFAETLISQAPLGPAGTGFDADDGAGLFMAFRGLQEETIVQGKAHLSLSRDLLAVADPFDQWSQAYQQRIEQNRENVLDVFVHSYEEAQGEVKRLKQQYLDKTRRADEAEDDAKFAPGGDSYTSSPRSASDGHRALPQRTATVSERIAARFRDLQKKSAEAIAGSPQDQQPTVTVFEGTAESPESVDVPLPKVDKGKGKEKVVLASPAAMSPVASPKLEITDADAPPPPPSTITLAGLSLEAEEVSALLTNAATSMPLKPVRFPLLGEYQDCFTGEEFVTWLGANVKAFDGNLDRAEQAARELTERENLLRRVGEFGNAFEDMDDAWYQFRPKAFELGAKKVETAPATPAKSPVKSQPDNVFARSAGLASLVSRAMSNIGGGNAEPTHIRARNDAEDADKEYRVAVRKLDRQRLGLEDLVEETLKTLERWELERLSALKTVLLQYQGTLATLPGSTGSSFERSSTLIAAFQPDSDLTALIERYRTGPFRPIPQVYESVAHDESDVVFGIDLRKWSEGGWYELTAGEEKRELVPPVFTALLSALWEGYGALESDDERRLSWIREVALQEVHTLREELNAIPPGQPFSEEMILKHPPARIASAIKLWLLELDPPLALYEGWDEFRKLYPIVGYSKPDGEKSAEDHLSELKAALLKLPRVHLYVLDGLFKHLRELIDNTDVQEEDDVYITKLAQLVGRTIIRPKVETEMSIQDRHPTLLVVELIKHYAVLLPSTIEKKKRESERKVPVRKRTKMVDMRLSRSRISVDANAQELLAAQRLAQNPSLGRRNPGSPPPPAAAPSVPFVPPPPPPPLIQTQQPARPSFKEPPPEVEGMPPRPMFKEPAPESEDGEKTPVRPNFVDAPTTKSEEGTEEEDDDDDEEEDSQAEDDKDKAKTPVAPNPGKFVPPPPPPPLTAPAPGPPPSLLPGHRKGPSAGAAYQARIAQQEPARATSPGQGEDYALGSGQSGLSRTGSGHGVRGPRTAGRGGRVGSGSVPNMVQNLNRGGAGGGGRRGARPALSSRTMASDAEDDIMDRK